MMHNHEGKNLRNQNILFQTWLISIIRTMQFGSFIDDIDLRIQIKINFLIINLILPSNDNSKSNKNLTKLDTNYFS